MQDLARCLIFGAEPRLRRELEGNIFERYHETLTKLLAEHGRQPPYTVEQVSWTLPCSLVDCDPQCILLCVCYLAAPSVPLHVRLQRDHRDLDDRSAADGVRFGP